MKFLASVFLVLFFACTVSAGEINRTMDIPNPDGSFSSMTFTNENRAFMRIYSSISVSDAASFWSDISILEHSTNIRIIDLFISSPGGDAFYGLALAGQIMRARNKGFKIFAYATGIIASAAVPIFISADHRAADPGTIFMVHQAAIWKWPGRETSSDIRSQNKMMELLKKNYTSILAAHSNLSAEEWEELQEKTTWFNAEQALKWGLVHSLE